MIFIWQALYFTGSTANLGVSFSKSVKTGKSYGQNYNLIIKPLFSWLYECIIYNRVLQEPLREDFLPTAKSKYNYDIILQKLDLGLLFKGN